MTTSSANRAGHHGSAGLDRTANTLGALALVIADQMADATAEAAGRAESAPAALAALLHFLDKPSVDRLRQVLGLSPSGTVRLLDRLEAAGLVERESTTDRRSSVIVLTAAGRAVAEGICRARADVLGRVTAVLSADERAQLDALVGKLLVGQMRAPGATRWICRLCDTGICRGSVAGCPVGNEAMRRQTAVAKPPP